MLVSDSVFEEFNRAMQMEMASQMLSPAFDPLNPEVDGTAIYRAGLEAAFKKYLEELA